MRTSGILWRPSARPVQFFFLDARSMICFFAWILYMSWPTFWLSVASLVLFFVFSRFGMTPDAAFRFLKLWPFSGERSHMSLYLARRRAR
jgi:hypothetical protein